MKNQIRIGVFETPARAEEAIRGLTTAGFAKENISLVCPECADGFASDVKHQEPAGTRTPAAAAIGGGLGALAGGLFLATGVVASGGTALFIAGPLLAAGTLGGSFVGAMLSRGLEPEISDYYDQALHQGQILVAIENNDTLVLERAEQVFAEAGALPVALPPG